MPEWMTAPALLSNYSSMPQFVKFPVTIVVALLQSCPRGC